MFMPRERHASGQESPRRRLVLSEAKHPRVDLAFCHFDQPASNLTTELRRGGLHAEVVTLDMVHHANKGDPSLKGAWSWQNW